MTAFAIEIDWGALLLVAGVAIVATVVISGLMSSANWFFVPRELSPKGHSRSHLTIDIAIALLLGLVLGMVAYQGLVHLAGWPAMNPWFPTVLAALAVLVLLVLVAWPTSIPQKDSSTGMAHSYRMVGFIFLGLIGCVLAYGLWLMIPYFH
ncbi:MAG: hypothetical protein FWG15_07805 [Propionibacteriaceae bacterium]|nr:hypothetical protein [Propionibacteriaceae bacterium]